LLNEGGYKEMGQSILRTLEHIGNQIIALNNNVSELNLTLVAIQV